MRRPSLPPAIVDNRFVARRFWLVFLPVFACYQAAEGVGMRLLGSAVWQGMLMTATIPLALLLGRRVYGNAAATFALERRAGAWRWLFGGLLLALAAKAAAWAVGQATGVYHVAPAALPAPGALLQAVALVLFTTIIPSLAEDMLTRGLWVRHGPLREGAGFVLLSTLVFVLNHIYRLANGPLEWLMLACFGLAYAAALARSGTLWAAVGLHWGWNAANGLLGQFVDVDVLQRAPATLLSASAHLVLLGIVLAVGGRSAKRQLAAPQ
ncbi:CPBP family intramembrane metalloprotease [Oxalobacteraceae bacterium OM1]|nr:CPBP family intramembrane metalloprotease [Oxalobacteraceae bacterium OM1]